MHSSLPCAVTRHQVKTVLYVACCKENYFAVTISRPKQTERLDSKKVDFEVNVEGLQLPSGEQAANRVHVESDHADLQVAWRSFTSMTCSPSTSRRTEW